MTSCRSPKVTPAPADAATIAFDLLKASVGGRMTLGPMLLGVVNTTALMVVAANAQGRRSSTPARRRCRHALTAQ